MKKVYYFGLAGIIILASLTLAVLSMKDDSLTMDELPHITAGYSYLTQKDMRLNPEHPPLIKDISAIPLLFQKLNFDKNHYSWKDDVNGQWAAGTHFIFESDNNPQKIIFWARFAVLFIFIGLGVLVFLWGSKKYGYWAGLMALILVAFSPNILAHARYVTTDVGAAFAFIMGTYFFINFVAKPSKKNLVLAGIAFGLAQLFKFSLFLLIPLFIFTLGIYWLAGVRRDWNNTDKKKRFKKFGAGLLGYAKSLTVIFVIGYLVVWPFYQYHVWNYPPERQKYDTEFTLSSFPVRPAAEAVVWMADKPVLRPYAQYLLGLLMVMQRTGGGNTAYFMGEVSSTAWKSYFPIVYGIKEPLPILILVLFSLLLGIYSAVRSVLAIKKAREILKLILDWTAKNFTEFVWLSFIVLYWTSSITGNLNIGLRHVLPTFPFIYLLVSGKISEWIKNKKGVFDKSSKIFLIAVALVWLGRENASIFPSYLAYFNQIAGGSSNGYKYAADSNLDWGQDLKRLREFADANGIQKIKVDYFGGSNLKYYLDDKYEEFHSYSTDRTGWIAVSATFLQGGNAVAAKGFDQDTNYYRWLDKYTPVAKIGYSIFVYHIE